MGRGFRRAPWDAHVMMIKSLAGIQYMEEINCVSRVVWAMACPDPIILWSEGANLALSRPPMVSFTAYHDHSTPGVRKAPTTRFFSALTYCSVGHVARGWIADPDIAMIS